MTATVVGIIASIISILAILLGLAFNMGKMASNLKQNTNVLAKVYELVTTQDDRIQDLENNKLDKVVFHDLEKDFIKLKTEHDGHHRKGK